MPRSRETYKSVRELIAEQASRLPVYTLSGVAALRDLLANDGTVRTRDISLVGTALAAVEQVNKAGGNPAARSPNRQ